MTPNEGKYTVCMVYKAIRTIAAHSTENHNLNMTRAKKELTIEQRAQIKALSDAGLSYQTIARDIKCFPITVKYTLDRYAECMYEGGRAKGTRMNAFCQL